MYAETAKRVLGEERTQKLEYRPPTLACIMYGTIGFLSSKALIGTGVFEFIRYWRLDASTGSCGDRGRVLLARDSGTPKTPDVRSGYLLAGLQQGELDDSPFG
jgi:hypothetical protein